MQKLKFYVKDQVNSSTREHIKETIIQLGLHLTENPEEADLIIVHRNTDGLGKMSGVTDFAVKGCLARNGIYIEYTTDHKTSWQKISQGYYGSHVELLNRLSKLKSPIYLEKIHQVLSISLNYIASLFILCQGYLTTYKKLSQISGTLEIEEKIEQFSNKTIYVASKEWWQNVLRCKDSVVLVQNLQYEWSEDNLPSEFDKLFASIYSDHDHSISIEVVEAVYEKLKVKLSQK